MLGRRQRGLNHCLTENIQKSLPRDALGPSWLWEVGRRDQRWLISPFASQGREHPTAHPSAAEGPQPARPFPPQTDKRME